MPSSPPDQPGHDHEQPDDPGQDHGCDYGCDHDHGHPHGHDHAHTHGHTHGPTHTQGSAQPGPSAAGNSLRSRIERASAPVVKWAATLPPWLPFAVMMVLIVGGALAGGVVGGIGISLAALAVAWLLYLSWPHQRPVERLMRLAILLLVLALAITRFLPQ